MHARVTVCTGERLPDALPNWLEKTNFLASSKGRYTSKTGIPLQRNIGRQRSLLLAETPYYLVGTFVGAKGAKT
jgi:hypothetical protein